MSKTSEEVYLGETRTDGAYRLMKEQQRMGGLMPDRAPEEGPTAPTDVKLPPENRDEGTYFLLLFPDHKTKQGLFVNGLCVGHVTQRSSSHPLAPTWAAILYLPYMTKAAGIQLATSEARAKEALLEMHRRALEVAAQTA